MSKKIALFCLLLGVVAFVAMPAYAEVQNIKVSGDITAMGVYRNNYDMEDSKTVVSLGQQANRTAEDEDSFFLSIVRLRVDADLTDNVGATVRLANLREWDDNAQGDKDIYVDLAYVTLKEMLYSPLTLVIGRQELMYGNGLIVGSGLYADPDGSIKYNDLSPLHGFDAVRAILDYNPWTLDLVAVKITEDDDAVNATPAQSAAAFPAAALTGETDADQDLYGVNLGYQFDQYDAEMEGYLFFKRDETYDLTVNVNGSPSNGRNFEENKVYTMGLRGSLVPLENLTLSGEIAGQWGKISDQQAGPDDNPLERDRSALAGDVAANYAFVDVRFAPTLGLEYLYLSGEEAGNDGDFDAWDPMFRGKIMGTIRDYMENLYTTYDPYDTNAWTNQHTVKVSGFLDLGELVDGLSLDLAYLHYWFDEEPIAGADDDIGGEVNMKLTYDYTEDVQFALNGAWFMAGDYYGKKVHNNVQIPMTGGGMEAGNTNAIANAITGRPANDTAVSIIGSCKVTF